MIYLLLSTHVHCKQPEIIKLDGSSFPTMIKTHIFLPFCQSFKNIIIK